MSTEQQQMQDRLDHVWQEPWTQNTWMSTVGQNPAARGLQPTAWMYTSEFIGSGNRQQLGETLSPSLFGRPGTRSRLIQGPGALCP